jgi:hypothetical protein
MKRPERYTNSLPIKGENLIIMSAEMYLCDDIDPLLDELELLRKAEQLPNMDNMEHNKIQLMYNDIELVKINLAEIQPEALNKPHTFPTWEEFQEWLVGKTKPSYETIYNYFKSRIQPDPIQDPIQDVIDILKSIREWAIGDNEYEALQDAIKILEESK